MNRKVAFHALLRQLLLSSTVRLLRQASYARPASRSPAFHALVVISFLAKRLRQVWPKVQIVLRADAGFCAPRPLNWCDRHRVVYVVRIGKNSRLLDYSAEMRTRAENIYQLTGEKQRWFREFFYRARS